MDEFLLVNFPPTRQLLVNQGPGIVSVALTTATIPMDNFSSDTLELMQRMVTDDEKAQRSFAACNARLAACAPPARALPVLPSVRGCVVEPSFEGLEPSDRDELLSYPTGFSLTPAQVKKLIAAGPTLLARRRTSSASCER